MAGFFIVDKEYKMGVQVKSRYELQYTKKIKLQKGRSLTFNQDTFYLPGIPLTLKYPNGVPIKSDKLRDMKMLTKFVEAPYMPFYNYLFKNQEASRPGTGGPDDPEYDLDDFLDY